MCVALCVCVCRSIFLSFHRLPTLTVQVKLHGCALGGAALSLPTCKQGWTGLRLADSCHWPDLGREETLSRPRKKGQESKEEEEEGPQRAPETCVSLRTFLQRHSGCHQGTEPQCHLWGCVKNCGLHVGQPGRGAEAGEPRSLPQPPLGLWGPGTRDRIRRCELAQPLGPEAPSWAQFAHL
jgi:hypothetical protein